MSDPTPFIPEAVCCGAVASAIKTALATIFPKVLVYSYWDLAPAVKVNLEQVAPFISVNAAVCTPSGVRSKTRTLHMTILIATHPNEDEKGTQLMKLYALVRPALEGLAPTDQTTLRTTEFLITGGSRGLDNRGAFIVINGTYGAVIEP